MTETNAETVRAEVRAWLEANWDPNLGLIEWRNRLIDSGWGAPHWPQNFRPSALVAPHAPQVMSGMVRPTAGSPRAQTPSAS